MAKPDITQHVIVPKHQKLSEQGKKELLEKYGLQGIKELPRILARDPALEGLDAKEGEIIKITRKSMTAGHAIFYRRVVNA